MPRRRNPNNYKPPKDQQQRMWDRKYIEFQSSPRLGKLDKEMRAPERCSVHVGGKLVFYFKEYANPRKRGQYYPVPWIKGGKRCQRPSVASRTVDGKIIRVCGEHSFDKLHISDEDLGITEDEVAGAS